MKKLLILATILAITPSVHASTCAELVDALSTVSFAAGSDDAALQMVAKLRDLTPKEQIDWKSKKTIIELQVTQIKDQIKSQCL